MLKKFFIIIYLLFTVSYTYAQITLKGTVKDSLQHSLSYTNVIAIPTDSTKTLKFAISDSEGYYKLELTKNQNYTISVSYLGYKTTSFKFTATKNEQKDFILNEAPNQLKEVVIDLPVTVKEDTIIYNTKKFVTGDERKLKNVLKKLPGVEVDKNGSVTVQGKKVTKMLVEGKIFFDGSSKLAVENIPADAVDKVQVIDNYSEIAFLKNVSDTDEMAMNIQLKKDKKKFVFGDVEAGKGNRNFYRTASNLFYYSPKTTVNFIGNLNNTGEKTFTFKDYINFQGGISAILKGDGSIYNVSGSNFSQFLETQDLIKSTNQFGALNVNKTISSKLTISGYAIFSHSNNQSLTVAENNYTSFLENQENNINTGNNLGIGKFTIDYKPNFNEQWYFKTEFKKSKNTKNNNIVSRINTQNNFISEINSANNSYFNENIEWHKQLSNKHIVSVATDFTFNKNNPNTLWKTNQSILQGLIPVIISETYKINQLKKVKNNSVQTIFKHYWVLNNFNHIYSTIGNQFNSASFFNDDSQELSDGTIHNFKPSGFGNDLSFKLNDFYFGIHYKFKTGILECKQGFYIHNYTWKINQQNNVNKQKAVILPDFLAKIEFSSSKKLQINYQLKSLFSDASYFANRFYLQSYNSVYKGNENLTNELFHSARIYYSRFSLYRGLMLFGSINYLKKIKGIQNQIQFENTNQYIYPIEINNPEQQWNFNISIDKKITQFKLSLKTSNSINTYFQKINDDLVKNKNNNFNYTISIKTLFDKFPTIETGFTKTNGNYTSNNQLSKFTTNEPFVSIDYNFLKSFIFSFDYQNYSYKNKTFNQNNNYQLANATLSYKKEDSAWSFKIDAKNLFDVKYKQQNSFSSYIISDTKTYILPISILFSVGYNL